MYSKYSIRLLLLFVLSCGCGKQGGGVREVGQNVGETVTDFARGVGTGIDRRMEVTAELSDELSQLGLTKTLAKSNRLDIDGPAPKGISVYFIAKEPLKARLLAKALNAEGQEIGRSTTDVEFAADDARYVAFAFDAELDSQLVAKYVIEYRPPVAKADQPADGAKPEQAPKPQT